jgi:hypothetical protein
MANIFGDFYIHGELYLRSNDQEPLPSLLSTDSNGKVIFTGLTDSISSTFPIFISESNGILNITHATSPQTTVTNSNRTVIQSITLDANHGHVLELSSLDLDDLLDDRYLRKDISDNRVGSLTQSGDLFVEGNILIDSSNIIDTIDTNGTLNIGIQNAETVNIGKIGSTINIVGDLIWNNATNLEITDQLIRLNRGGNLNSSFGSGFEIEANGNPIAYIKTDNIGEGWDIKVPSINYTLNLSLENLTTNRSQDFQNQNGTIALIGIGLNDTRYVNDISATSPISVSANTNIVNITHNDSGWTNKTTLSASTVISNLTVDSTGHISNWTTRDLSLTNISDVILDTPINGEALIYNGNNWENGVISGSSISGYELSKVDDTNVTIVLSGTASNVLLNPITMTLGWTGQLGVNRGGTGASSLTGIVIGNGTSSMTTTVGTANQLLRRNSTNTAYEFFTHTFEASFDKGGLTSGTGITLSGTLINRLVGTGDITFGLTGQALDFHNLATNGFVVRTGSGVVTRSFTAGTGISITNNDGISGNPTISSTITQYTDQLARLSISLTTTGNSGTPTYNDTTGVFNIPNYTLSGLGGEPSFLKGSLIQGDGITLTGTLTSRLVGTGDITITHPVSGITAGSYNNVTVNSLGHVILGSNVSYLTAVNLGYTSDTNQGTVTNSAGTPSVIPAASTTIAGLITNGTQTMGGAKTFNNTITATNFITTSDIRIKSDIKPIENAISLLEKLTSYEYIKSGNKEAGFIAQEVKEVLPYTVFTNEDGLLTMSDRPILAYIHKAILELKEEIEKLKN